LTETAQAMKYRLMTQAVLHCGEPAYPTISRQLRVKMKKAEKVPFCNTVRLWAASFDFWAIQALPPTNVVTFEITKWVAPFLLLLTIWDILALTVFESPHFSSLNQPGIFFGELVTFALNRNPFRIVK